MRRSLTYGGTQKLKSRKLIEQVFREGRSFSIFPFRVLYLFPSIGIYNLQAGFAVSTKNFKKAVDRNRIKRLMREAYRLQKTDLEDALLKQSKRLAVFVIYSGNSLPDYQEIFNKMTHVLNRISKIADENTVANI